MSTAVTKPEGHSISSGERGPKRQSDCAGSERDPAREVPTGSGEEHERAWTKVYSRVVG